MSEISVTRVDDTRFRVVVTEGETETVHEVTLAEKDRNHYGGDVQAEHLIQASFKFLLEREPKESILRTFSIPIIERYFPEYPAVIRRRL